MVNVRPTSGYHVFVGWCIKRATAGKILIKIIRHPISSEIDVLDTAGYYIATTLEEILAEIGGKISSLETRVTALEQV